MGGAGVVAVGSAWLVGLGDIVAPTGAVAVGLLAAPVGCDWCERNSQARAPPPTAVPARPRTKTRREMPCRGGADLPGGMLSLGGMGKRGDGCPNVGSIEGDGALIHPGGADGPGGVMRTVGWVDTFGGVKAIGGVARSGCVMKTVGC